MSESITSRRRVLVVDDNADLAQMMGEFIRGDPTLEFVGYVRTGAEAVENAHRGAADVFVLDLSLRDISGFKVLERLTADAPAIKVIIHTGHAFDGLDAYVKRQGAAGYLVKDGNPDALLNALHGV